MLLTVLVPQYKPDKTALRRTLISLALQTTHDFAVVLADDGSENDYFAESTEFLRQHGFAEIATTKQTPNGGTVKNVLAGLEKVTTRWVLALAPGDLLYDTTTIAWWLARLQTDEPRVAFAKQAYFAPGDTATPLPGESPFDRTPYDPDHYNAAAVKRNLLLYDDGISGCGMVYETALFKQALQMMAGHVKLADDFAVRVLAVQGIRITRYDRLTSWYEYGTGVSTDSAAFARMRAEWQAMVELLYKTYPQDKTVRLAHLYFLNERHRSRLVRGLVGRLVVPQNCAFKRAQRAWQPPTNGDTATLAALLAAARLPETKEPTAL